MDIAQLNTNYGQLGRLKFISGQGDLPFLEITHPQATALISLYAGQVLSFQPKSATEDVIFVSDQASYQSGKAIRGGTPICWPWFGPDPEGLGRAAHGFVRNRMWKMMQSQTTVSGETQVTLGLSDTPETQAIWPHPFELSLVITVGASLTMELITCNSGNTPFTIAQALHTYFKVGGISQVQVLGLEDVRYLDKTDGSAEKTQVGSIKIDREVDRVYQNVTAGELVIVDPVYGRRIYITAQGSKTAIVWNPWIEIAARMADLDDADYQRFVCVETANAAADVVTVAPDSTARLMANYRVEPGL
jgi:glucose-6-phosphate 1-epimerase